MVMKRPLGYVYSGVKVATGQVEEQVARFTRRHPSQSSAVTFRVAAAAALLLLTTSAVAKPLETVTVQNAARVLQESVNIPSGIPLGLMSNAQALVIIPDVLKLGFIVGGRRGHGVVVVRTQDGSWSNPVFVTITGGSVGYQAGVQATDVILVFRSNKSVGNLLSGQFTLGADAAVAAGPVGRQAAASTNIQMQAEIYSYSRSRGLFAGVSLDGSALQIDSESNATYYASPGIAPFDVLAGRVGHTPAEVTFLKDLLTKYAPPVPGATVGVDLSTLPGPTNASPNLEATRQQLAASSAQLQSRLEPNWRQYLALPPGVASPGPSPSVPAVNETLRRFDTVARDSQYQVLTQMPEFRTTYGLLRQYAGGLSELASRPIATSTMPPPPATTAPQR